MVNPDNCFQKELLAWAPSSLVCLCGEDRPSLHKDEASTQRAFQLQSVSKVGSSMPAELLAPSYSSINMLLTHIISFIESQVNVLHRQTLLWEKCETIFFTSKYRSLSWQNEPGYMTNRHLGTPPVTEPHKCTLTCQSFIQEGTGSSWKKHNILSFLSFLPFFESFLGFQLEE